jgi:hypothetical protein
MARLRMPEEPRTEGDRISRESAKHAGRRKDIDSLQRNQPLTGTDRHGGCGNLPLRSLLVN